MQIDFKKHNQLIITCDEHERFVVQSDRNGDYHISTYLSNQKITNRLVEELKNNNLTNV